MDKNKLQITPNEYLDLFDKAMKKLSLAVDKPIGEARTLIYFEHLHAYSIEEIQAAVNRAIHEEEYPQIPPVGKLVRYIEEEREETRRGSFLMESAAFLEERPQSREEGKTQAVKVLRMIDTKISEIEGKEKEKRGLEWEVKKKILKDQAKLITLNSKGEK